MPKGHGQTVSDGSSFAHLSYLRAGLPKVATAQPPVVPKDQGQAVAGSVLYVRYGCVNCHGPNGLGGVPNPSAPDKTATFGAATPS